ncbi:PKD domain-containing protein, partial [Candidatus Woesearchaeota archaeon]|nr:PKD domain-containing protein [Candidatus Woesearchaeota archaeon]
ELTTAECNQQYTRCKVFANPSNGQQSCTDLTTTPPISPCTGLSQQGCGTTGASSCYWLSDACNDKKANSATCASDNECRSDYCDDTQKKCADAPGYDIAVPTNFKVEYKDNSAVLTWNPSSVRTLTPNAGAAVTDTDMITGNAGFIDSITGFFKKLFGIGARGTVIRRQQTDIVYDVRRDGELVAQDVICLTACQYIDRSAVQGESYTYVIGARFRDQQPSASLNHVAQTVITIPGTQIVCESLNTVSSVLDRASQCADISVRCDWDAVNNSCLTKVEIPAPTPPGGTQPPAVQPLTCLPRTSVATYNSLDFNVDNGVDMVIGGSGVEGLSGQDGILFKNHFDINSQSANWDAKYDLNGDCYVNFDDFFLLIDLFGQPPGATVLPKAPEVSFEVLQGYNSGIPLNFDASASKDDDGTIVSYKWNFGDNSAEQTINIPQTSHIYATFGNYVAVLTITDDDGLTATAQRDIRINNLGSLVVVPLNVDFTYRSNAIVGEEITFTGTAEDVAVPIQDLSTGVTYEWEFGDNSAKLNGNPVRHFYAQPGTYNVKATATKGTDTGGFTKIVIVTAAQESVQLALPSDVNLSYAPIDNRISVKWKDVSNEVTVANGRGRSELSYIISREAGDVNSEEYATVRAEDVCNDNFCAYTDSEATRSGVNYVYRVKAAKGVIRSTRTQGVSISVPSSCVSANGDGCTVLLQGGESETAAGNNYCNLVNSGKCVKCDAGFRWDLASNNCLFVNPKANGESCNSGNECASGVCTSNVCSEITRTELAKYDLNNDNCVDRADHDVLATALANIATINPLTYDLDGNGKLDLSDGTILADKVGLGDACPITKADFDNNRCVDNADKVILQNEIAKPEASRNAKRDLNADTKVDTNDLTAFRSEFRKGGGCNPLSRPVGDLDWNYCIDERDEERMQELRIAGSQTAVAQNDLNGDDELDNDDVEIIRRSFGDGDNCPAVVIRWGDFNSDNNAEIVFGSDVGSLVGADGVLFRNHINTKEGDAIWDKKFDLNGDKIVNSLDYDLLFRNFGIIEETVNFNTRSGGIETNLIDSKIRLIVNPEGTEIQTKLNGKYGLFSPVSDKIVRDRKGLNFVTLKSVADLTDKIQSISISITYNESEAQRLGISESTLKMYYYNPSTDGWELIDNSIDTENNLVTGATNHLSDYGLFGESIVTAPPGDSGGDGGGSSGGSSGGKKKSQPSSSCSTVLIENLEGDCKRACQSSLDIWQNSGYNVVDSCSIGEPQQPVSPSTGGEDYPTIEDYERAGINRNDADSDNDGILDDLELQFFGDLTQGFDDDYDGDGIVNGKEINVDQTNPTDPSDFLTEQDGGNTGIIIGVIVIIIGAGIGTFVWMRKKGKLGVSGKASSRISPKSAKVSLTDQEKKIVTYIKDARTAGMKDSEIKSNLVKAGWKGSQVENAFSSLK